MKTNPNHSNIHRNPVNRWKYIAVMLFVCLNVNAEESVPDADFDQFVGDWGGQGHFYNTNMNSELGTIRFTLRVTPELEITGTAGNAEVVDAEITVDDWNDSFMIKATLAGKIVPSHEFEKKRITLLLNDVKDGITEGDFHLTNNFIFDFSMRPGAITLQRNP